MTTRDATLALALVADPTLKLSEFLQSGTYFDDPASTKYHRAYRGGLADHCLGVFVHLHRLSLGFTAAPTGPAPSVQALATIALCHDLCKVGRYRVGYKNVKDDTGHWDKVPIFEYATDETFILGHADQSLFIAQDVLGRKLLPDVAMAIRFHMGLFGAAPGEETSRMTSAMALTPLVVLTQAADLLDTHRPKSDPDDAVVGATLSILASLENAVP